MDAPAQHDEPVLEWRDGQPCSRRYADIYFSRAGGLDETRHVFLRGNRLPERFAALPPHAAFVVGETGFGTGLNFLCTWQLFRQCASDSCRLHYVSTELHPLSAGEIGDALALFEEIGGLRVALLAQYRALSAGWHRLQFEQGRVRLTLLIGDARITLRALQARVDAWFLDGFSPARNPALWEEDLFRTLAARSHSGATVATYSSAGNVRRALAAAGFNVRKAPGFGPKREMVCGELSAAVAPLPPAPQRYGRQRYGSQSDGPGRHAVVIGAGLAGASAARSLAERGWRVDLLERAAQPAAGASGNPVGILYARLSASATPLHELVLAGYQYTLRRLRALLPCDGVQWSDCPVLQLAFDGKEARRHSALLQQGWPAELLHAVDATAASQRAGIPLRFAALCFPSGGWVHPPALVAALAAHPNIALHTHAHAVTIERQREGWCVRSQEQPLAQAPTLIVAAANDALRFAQLAHLPLRANRGQITLAPATAQSAALQAVLCGQGYVAPAREGVHILGATFARSDSIEPDLADTLENLHMLAGLSPQLHAALALEGADPVRLGARTALRCTSPDYLPLVGPVGHDTDGEAESPCVEGACMEGLYTTVAHGSRGLISAPLCGEVLAATLEDEPAPLPAPLMAALLPRRFGSTRR